MIFRHIKSDIEVRDQEFDLLFPAEIRLLADLHFSPVEVSKMAARFLTKGQQVKVLDIGAGVGKFCLVASACADGYFVGVEQRESLCRMAQEIAEGHALKNVVFIHANILNIPFEEFGAFYFYNSFQENIFPEDIITPEVELSRELYFSYSLYVKEQLDQMPPGTRLATYFAYHKVVPDSYELQDSVFDHKLKFWQKRA